jgi:glycosyltransferase involved in cell wall biosynthesis
MSMPLIRVALVEPYLGGSHRAWAEGYVTSSVHDVELFGLPAVHWKWRMQGGHVTLAEPLSAAVAERGPFDVVLSTSMCNVAALVGVARSTIGDAPIVMYMHENQLTFPLSPDDREDLTYPMINWTSMVASDAVVFNSQYHHDEWFEALPGFLARFPDHRHGRMIDAVRAKASVLPVGCDLRRFDEVPRLDRERPLVLWNQRWEYDKGPGVFASAIERLLDDGVDFDLALAGERSSQVPPEFERLQAVLGDRLVHAGWAETTRYVSLLRSADVVVSTAQHEFFGIAVTEAVYAGAFPVLPNRLVYPERLPADVHDRCLYVDADGLHERLRWALDHRSAGAEVAVGLRPAMAAADWSAVAPCYDRLLAGLV